MFLKRLDISGFKSFSARSVLDFEKGENITAIVGPNGSGKSNIADSIRWVLGETSYKTVRAKKSEDVIFSGSNSKAKASFARVSMQLDNADGKAPIDFTEVEIARSVFRDGSSEYLINGRKSRLLDVAELLAKAGFGQSTYSVIGQGMVDSMLFYGPAERKVLFDEAAGVRSYEMKREQTIKKLEDTAQNLIRINDILSELTPRLNTLRRQAEKAKEKDDVKNELLEKQKTYFASIWDRITVAEKGQRSDLEHILAEEVKVKEEIEDLNTKFTQVLSMEKESTENTADLDKKLSELEAKKDETRQKIYTLRAKVDVLSLSLTKEDIEEKIEEQKKLITEIKIEEKEAEKVHLTEKISGLGLEKIAAEISSLEQERNNVSQQIYTKRAQLQVNFIDSALTKEEIGIRIRELEAQINDLNIGKLESDKTKLGKELAGELAEIEDIVLRLSATKNELGALSEELAGFDFGAVNTHLSEIIADQQKFIQKLEKAKNGEEITGLLESGRNVSKRLTDLAEKVGNVKEGKITGMAELQKEIEALTAQKETAVQARETTKSAIHENEYLLKGGVEKRSFYKEEIAKLRQAVPVDEGERKEMEAEIAGLEKELTKKDEKVAEAKKTVSESEALTSELRNLDFEIERGEARKKELEEEIKKLEKVKPVDGTEKKKIEEEIELLHAESGKWDQEIEKVKEEIKARSHDFSAQSKDLTDIKDDLAAKQSLENEYAQEASNLRVDLAKFDTRKQDLREEIGREIGSEAALADAKVLPELEEGAAREEIEKLKTKLYAIGEIDPEVETEYKEVGSRVEFLSTQTKDLENAKSDLEKLVSELDGRIKKQFEQAFSAISERFTHFFTLLFDGGTAKLELTRIKDEEEETEEFGIEITAIPPGKRVQTLSALSGGERTMTSLALLFAILSVNPAPFCVLDEVDAALDETNTKKFLKIIHELAHSTQFIFISHNRETMKAANMIYGITMDETHASKLLSIKLSEAMEVAEETKKDTKK